MSRGANVNSRGVTQSGRGLQIGSVSTATTLIWSAASDWDNAVSESGVAHENTANTDHTDAALLKQGYQIGSPYLSSNLVGYWPLHEDSGSTAYDLSGNGNDGTISGATVGQTGLLGTTAYSFDGTDDSVEIPDSTVWDFGTGTFSFSAWFNTSVDHNGRILSEQTDNSTSEVAWFVRTRDHDSDGNSELQSQLRDSNGNLISLDGPTTVTDGAWHLTVVTVDVANDTARLYLDATEEVSNTSAGWSGNFDSADGPDLGALVFNDAEYFDGKIADPRVYNTLLTASEIQTLYDVVDTPGTLTTATKSFTNAQTPDLQNLDYTLNGVTDIQLDIIGSPGTADEEIVTQQLDGASSYTLSWASSHTDFRVKPYPDNENVVTRTPTINRIELVA